MIGDAAKPAVSRAARAGAAPREATPAQTHLTARGPELALWGLATLLLLFLALPVVALLVRALGAETGWNADALHVLRQALGLSLVTTAVAMTVVIVLGTPLAYLLARRRFPGSSVVTALVDLPLVLPPAVAGIALLMAFGRNGLIGQWLAAGGITLGFTTAAVVMAQIFVAAPFYVIAARGGFSRVDTELEAAAADLGAPPGRVMRTVTLPLVLPSLIAGAVLAWARALGEFGATILFAGSFAGVTQTMPLAIYGRFGAGDLPTALLLSMVLLVASLAVLLGVRLAGERIRGGM